eukprot:TRINITY_DN41168_c0_g1_i1.p1 TRINITY_DN41168_c0_g1~~TRINITY_DN41168_c0_g1_i1.p1  ORF type:complete len:314 (+),score=73.46 TRINITY_DN41168_c0_g1_i1:96-944(+)
MALGPGSLQGSIRGAVRKRPKAVDDAAASLQAVSIPEFLDPDEDLVRSWFGGSSEGTGGAAKTSNLLSTSATEAWLASVVERRPRPNSLGLGAEPVRREDTKEAFIEAAGPQLNKAVRRLVNRKARREDEEAQEAESWKKRTKHMESQAAQTAPATSATSKSQKRGKKQRQNSTVAAAAERVAATAPEDEGSSGGSEDELLKGRSSSRAAGNVPVSRPAVPTAAPAATAARRKPLGGLEGLLAEAESNKAAEEAAAAKRREREKRRRQNKAARKAAGTDGNA